MFDCFARRRSVRKFTDTPLTPEEIDAILRAGLIAPSGHNTHSPRFLVVRDIPTIQSLTAVRAQKSASGARTAQAVIVVLGDIEATDTWIEDASIAAAYMQLEIAALGLGSTWIQIDKRQLEDGRKSADLLREKFAIPANLKPLCFLIIGHPLSPKAPYVEADADFSRVARERF